MNPPSRGRGKSYYERPVNLCADDQRKLYALLDSEVPRRLRRIELGIVALFVAIGGDRAAEVVTKTSPVEAFLGIFL